MKGFFQLISSAEFLELLDRFQPLESEQLELGEGLGRIIAGDITAPEHLPPFSRSTMDGYVVRARNTFGCSESEPALLKVIGEIVMGKSGHDLPLPAGHAAAVWTGGELPAQGDAVVMVEYTNRLDSETIEVFRPVAPGENVISRGEDFRQQQTVLRKGHTLRPQDLGVLAGLGITRIPVYRKPVVAVISTGDELLAPDEPLAPGKIRDINSTTLTALIRECGADPRQLGIIGDDPELMLSACEKALQLPADVVLLSGGSSVGRRDYTLEILEKIDRAELLVHGISVRPGKPTILAKKENTALFGLPGHAGSAMVIFHLFVRPLLRRLTGKKTDPGLRRVRAITAEQIPSVIGREDFIRVFLDRSQAAEKPRAVPVYGKSGLLNPLVRAEGLLIIDRDTEGLDKGEEAEVLLFP